MAANTEALRRLLAERVTFPSEPRREREESQRLCSALLGARPWPNFPHLAALAAAEALAFALASAARPRQRGRVRGSGGPHLGRLVLRARRALQLLLLPLRPLADALPASTACKLKPRSGTPFRKQFFKYMRQYQYYCSWKRALDKGYRFWVSPIVLQDFGGTLGCYYIL